jgi:DNA-binding MarR family transcriptional regulator/GNAT superfamily N-acetyltransferase
MAKRTMPTTPTAIDRATDPIIARVREFNRFYTRRIGVLRPDFLGSEFSLTEVRVLYELAHREQATASELVKELELDPGFVSRLLKSFERQGLVERQQSRDDKRARIITLTTVGRQRFASLDARQVSEVEDMLRGLSEEKQRHLLSALRTVRELLTETAPQSELCVMREPEPGDVSFITFRHGVLYSREFGLGQGFEAHISQVLSPFLQNRNEAKERLWVAEIDGDRVGSLAVLRGNAESARIEAHLVEPEVRRRGIGRQLLNEGLRFARSRGYRQAMLSMPSILQDARRLYDREGFQCLSEQRDRRWGTTLSHELWELDLRQRRGAER